MLSDLRATTTMMVSFPAEANVQLVQATDHRGLQVQNFAGEWIDVPRRPDTFVVNIGKGLRRQVAVSLEILTSMHLGLETLTSGVAPATAHRVVSPPPGSGTRYSVPFFQQIVQRVVLGEAAAKLKCRSHSDISAWN